MTETELEIVAARWRQRALIAEQLRRLRLYRIVHMAPLGRFSRQVDCVGSWADLQGVRVSVLVAGSMIGSGTLGTWPGKELMASKHGRIGSIGPEAV